MSMSAIYHAKLDVISMMKRNAPVAEYKSEIRKEKDYIEKYRDHYEFDWQRARHKAATRIRILERAIAVLESGKQLTEDIVQSWPTMCA